MCGIAQNAAVAIWSIGLVGGLLGGWAGSALAQQTAADAWVLDQTGDSRQAEQALRRAVDQAATQASTRPEERIDALDALAQFLDRHGNSEARLVYQQLLDAYVAQQRPAEDRARILLRLAALDAAAGEHSLVQQRLADYRAAGGGALTLPDAPPAASPTAMIEIPGPIRSFARMAALSPELAPEEIMPVLARNVVMTGYRAEGANDTLEQTEFLSLILRYLTQAKELDAMAGEDRTIVVEQCESAETATLLRIIGYRMRGGCGAEVVLETINASRAFLTTDSGFPLGELELALRNNQRFEYDYHPTIVPVLYTRDYWQDVEDQAGTDLLMAFLTDPSLSRLYAGMAQLDPATAEALRARIPSRTLKLYAHVLDFFGGMFEMRDGRAMVPGGPATEGVWEDLNGGKSPRNGAEFFERMLLQDDGWLASYYDAVARVNGPLQDYLLEPRRLERFYEALRGRVTTPGPARPVFRSNTDMLLLTARLHLDADGTPHLPGGLEVWKSIFSDPPRRMNIDGKLKKAARDWKEKDQVVEAMFGQARLLVENQALKLFMALTDLDRGRREPLDAATVRMLADNFVDYSSQFPLFSEVPNLSPATIGAYLDAAKHVADIGSQTRRADAAGILQALASLWQIFSRQQMIAPERMDATLAAIAEPFRTADSSREIFDAGRTGVDALLGATASPPSETMQGRMLDLLAGTSAPSGSVAYRRLVGDLLRIFEAQRLIELDDIFALADQMESLSLGKELDLGTAARLAARITEIRLPEGSLTRAEKNGVAFGYWSMKHIDDQRDANLRRDVERNADDAEDLWNQREKLTPYLRDTLVGFVYMHYAPPGAQILRTNPMFVRNHDFLGTQGFAETWTPTRVYGQGWPRNAGGRLIGSLSSLPYALAQAEQNFLVPTEEQALIWVDLVPQMMLSAVVPRFWNVTPQQLHWVGMNMAYAQSLIAEASFDPARRERVTAILASHVAPLRLRDIDRRLASGDAVGALEKIMPAEMYQLAREALTSPGVTAESAVQLAATIRRLENESAEQVTEEAISHAFGSPKPTLANSYRPELLQLRTFPTLMGYSSRVLAESWESNLLYFASLADQIHAAPEDLNYLVPEWTQDTAERIFANHLEDWPALLRSLRATGDNVLREENARVTIAPETNGAE